MRRVLLLIRRCWLMHGHDASLCMGKGMQEAASELGLLPVSCADDTLYCGITNDLDKRLAAHNAAQPRNTRGTRPGGTVFVEECEDRSAASNANWRSKPCPG